MTSAIPLTDDQRRWLADLYEANLAKADLRHATLSGADLTKARIAGADMRGAALDGVDLKSVKRQKRYQRPAACQAQPVPESP